nr:hypothetical protein [uncultured Neisseria sp.]
MINAIKKLLIKYLQHEIRSLEQQQDTILHICTSSAAKLEGYERKILIEESLLMIKGIGRKITRYENRIQQLEMRMTCAHCKKSTAV